MIDKIRCAQSHVLLDMACEQLGSLSKYVFLDEQRSIFDAGTAYDDYNRLRFHVGVNELKRFPNKELPVGQALVPIVNLFHEVYGHGGQIACEFKKDTALSQVLALNYYACHASGQYYGFKTSNSLEDAVLPHYFRQSHEVAAQYAGVSGAFGFLSNVYGPSDANEMLCEYLQFRVRGNSEFISPRQPITSVDTALRDFDVAFKRNLFCHKPYSCGKGVPDYLQDYIQQKGGKHYATLLALSQDGLKQDLMLTAVYVDLKNAGHYIRSFPAFHNVDLSIGHAFSLVEAPVSNRPEKQSLCLHDLSGLDDVKDAISQDFGVYRG